MLGAHPLIGFSTACAPEGIYINIFEPIYEQTTNGGDMSDG